MGTVGLADVRQAGAGGPLMFFQLYVLKIRGFVRQLIQRERSSFAQIHCSRRGNEPYLRSPAVLHYSGTFVQVLINLCRLLGLPWYSQG